MINNSLRVWLQISKAFKLPNTSLLAPVCRNHAFKPSLLDPVFTGWARKGILTLRDLYIDNNFATFPQLTEKYDLPASHFFRYLQIRNYVRSAVPNFETLSADSELYKLLTSAPNTPKLVTKFVDFFTSQLNFSTIHQKSLWEEELDVQLSEEDWEKCLKNIYTCSINARHQLIQYKVLHRLHYSRVKLNSFYPTISPLCNKCEFAEGSLGHLFWGCPKLGEFWSEVFQFLSEVYACELPLDPATAILGWSASLLRLNNAIRLPIQYGLMIAKKSILCMWKKNSKPLFKFWLSELSSTLHVERLRYTISGNIEKFEASWRPLFNHLLKISNVKA